MVAPGMCATPPTAGPAWRWPQAHAGNGSSPTPEFTASRRCHLIVRGIETCGRWGDEAIALLRGLAQAKAWEVTPYLRGASAGAYTSRWAWPSQPNGRSQRACSSCPWVATTTTTTATRSSTWCWRTRATTRAHRPSPSRLPLRGGCT